MPDQTRLQEHHFHYTLNRNLSELYAATTIRTFGIGLILIFEPIYLYQVFGESLAKTFFFFAILYLMTGILAPLGMKVVAFLGVKKSMLASVPFILGYYYALWHIGDIGVWAFALPLFMAVHNSIYWPAFHIDFAHFSDKGKRGRETSYAIIAVSLASGVAPLLGGIIIASAGFPILFAAVLAFFFASSVPLMFSKDIHERYQDGFDIPFREMFFPKHRKKALAFAAEAGDFIIFGIVWPLFLFLLAISFEALGLITTGALLIGMILSFYVGRLADKQGPERLLGIGAVVSAILWPIRMFVRTPFDAFLAHLLHGFGRSMVFIPFGTIFYNWVGSAGFNRERYILIRSVSLNMSGGMLLLGFAGVSLITDELRYTFLLGSVFSLLLVLVVKDPLTLVKRIWRRPQEASIPLS